MQAVLGAAEPELIEARIPDLDGIIWLLCFGMTIGANRTKRIHGMKRVKGCRRWSYIVVLLVIGWMLRTNN